MVGLIPGVIKFAHTDCQKYLRAEAIFIHDHPCAACAIGQRSSAFGRELVKHGGQRHKPTAKKLLDKAFAQRTV